MYPFDFYIKIAIFFPQKIKVIEQKLKYKNSNKNSMDIKIECSAKKRHHFQ